MQRFFDIFFSLVALILLSPLLIFIVFILGISGEREILFKQNRIGKNGKIFKLIKFSTMLKDSPNIGTKTITIKDDPRILPFGKILRKTKINELPQLVNILKGDMSLIGPRPLSEETFNFYDNRTKKYIKKMKPGLSGIGSIIFRSEEEMLSKKNLKSKHFLKLMKYKGSLEEWYYYNQSIKIYFLLIVITILVVIIPYKINLNLFFKNLPLPQKDISHLFY